MLNTLGFAPVTVRATAWFATRFPIASVRLTFTVCVLPTLCGVIEIGVSSSAPAGGTPTVYRTSKDPSELAKMVLSYKNYRWLYEREWRMFAQQGKIHYRDTHCVTHVYFGSRTSSRDKKQLAGALKG